MSARAVGAIVIGFVVRATLRHVLANDLQIAHEAAMVAAFAVAAVVFSSAIFAALNDGSSPTRIGTGISPRSRRLPRKRDRDWSMID